MTKRILLSTLLALPTFAHAADDPPAEWIDPDTHHRVVRLSTEPGTASLYFHQNPYSPDGKRLLVTTPSGLATIDLSTRKIEPIVEGRVRVIITGHKTGDIYYMKDEAVFAASIATKQSREIAKIPPGGTVNSVNADETLLAGTITHAPAGAPPATQSQSKASRIEERYNQHLSMELFTIDIKTGQSKKFHPSTEWLNHLQFSPTDPGQLLFCHEGPWHKVDRTWLIRADGSGLVQVHRRTMQMEIEGHEFFSADGKSVWYDLQTPRGEDFWLGGYEIATAARTWYHLQRDEWSVHFNVSHDGKLFAGDGGSDGMVAHAKNGKWIYLFRPELIPNRAADSPGQANLIRTGVLRSERLVNMSKHDYSLEPNVTFTPDDKWIVFRTNMFGPTHVFAVEIDPVKSP
jgi:oligogalacturonide lyase